ncbi:MAG: hypothetical protein Q9226_003903 [Calogaya cf. arnoldii]
MPQPHISKILLIDAYDSFSNNIVSLFEERLAAVQVTVIKIDAQIADLPAFLRSFDAVVAGPGPGHPENAWDIGLIAQLWQLGDEDLLPVLGICLGFQSLVFAFGGSVVPLPEPRHGIVRKVTSTNTSIFRGLGRIAPVQYHSLHAVSDHRQDLGALAWDLEADNRDTDEKANSVNPDAILMAVQHKTKPFWGLQFHPESICSDQASKQLVDNWWAEAQSWNSQHRPLTRTYRFNEQGSETALKIADPPLSFGAHEHLSLQKFDSAITSCHTATTDAPPTPVIHRKLPLGDLNVPCIWDLLRVDESDAIVLDSEPHQRAETGTHSILGSLGPTTVKLEYFVASGKVRLIQGAQHSFIDLASYGGTIFGYLKAFIGTRKATGGDPDSPFWGGLVGYINYEACLETIDIKTTSHPDKPDVSFVFVERSIVIDHQRQQLHIQSIKSEDEEWVETISSHLAAKVQPQAFRSIPINPPVLDPVITHPGPTSYAKKIEKCQDYIHRGDAYELCLTDQATVDSSHIRDPWPLYLHLRSVNAAPFSAYMRLGGMALLSSSPERFMRWTRPIVSLLSESAVSTVQFRPIKGTVKRYPTGPGGPAITLEQATALLSTPKERAENLMIVDLIRHDLHGVVGSSNLCVPKLMVVEEYATLFQLVTVVEGSLINQCTTLSNVPSLTASPESSPGASRSVTPASSAGDRLRYELSDRSTARKTGIDVLAASLPPGSMTGAPKRRSCALLRQIEEEKPRGIYSGVVGYMDVGGGGDFSVVIRSAVRWDRDTGYQRDWQEKRDKWTVGAGGAITALSTEQGEWEEMRAKLSSTLTMFGQGESCRKNRTGHGFETKEQA